MSQRLEITVDKVFGLGFDVKKDPATKSGYGPAGLEYSSFPGVDFLGDVRLEGFAAMMNLGFAKHLCLVSGWDFLYESGSDETIHEAKLIKEMLVADYGIQSECVSCLESGSHTRGNMALIAQESQKEKDLKQAVVSNHYHCPRFSLDLTAAGGLLPAYPAEAFLLIKGGKFNQNWLINRFGGGALANRCSHEIKGVADKIMGKYKPLNTMTAPK